MVTRQIEVVVALRALDNVSGVLGRIGGSFSNLGRQLRATGTALSIGLTLPLLGLGRAVIGAAGTFEDQMIRMQIAADASAEEMAKIEQAALDFGRTTIFSATDSAEAMIDMFKAGLTLEQILGQVEGQVGGFEAAARLAAASNLSLEEATSTVISSLAKMGLEFDSSTELIDSFVAAADASIAEVSDLSEAWKNAGNTLVSFGFDINDINTAFALLSQQGLQGAEAGTRLRRMLTNMMRDTGKVQETWEELGFSFFTAEGEMRPMIEVLDQLRDSLSGMNDEQRKNITLALAGSHGQDLLNAFLRTGQDEWDRIGAEMEEVASAQEIATARTESFQGQMKILMDTIQNLLIKAGQPLIEDFLKPAIKILQQFASDLQDNMNPEFVKFAAAVGLLLLVLGPAVFLLGAILSPMGLLIGLAATLGASFISASGGIEGAVEILNTKFSAALERAREAIDRLKVGDLSGAFEALGASDAVVQFFADIETALANLKEFWDQNGEAILGSFGQVGEAIAGMISGGAEGALEGFGDALVNATQWIVDNGPEIADSIQSIADFITQDFLPALKDIADWVSQNEDVILGFFIALGAILAAPAIAGAIAAIAGFIGTLVSLGGTIAVLIGGIAGFADIMAGVALIVGVLGGPITVLIAALGILVGVIIIFGKEAKKNFLRIIGLIGIILGVAIERVKEWGSNIVDNMIKTVEDILASWDEFKENWAAFWDGIKAAISTKASEIKASLIQAWADLMAAWQEKLGIDFATLFERWRLIWEDIKLIAEEVWDRIKESVMTKIREFVGGVIVPLLEMKERIDQAWEELKTAAGAKWEEIKLALAAKALEIITSINETLAPLRENLETAWENIKTAAGTAWEAVKAEILGVADTVAGEVGDKVDNVKTAIDEKFEDFKSAGANLIQGLIDGALGMAGELINAITTLVERAVKAAKERLGIESPSEVFKQMGINMQLGLIKGLRERGTAIQSAATNLVGDVAATSGAFLGGPPAPLGLQPAPAGAINVFVDIERVGNDVDVELLARRIAEVISQRQRIGGGRF